MSLSIAHILEVPLQKCPATLIRPAVQEKLRLSRSNALLLVDFNERNIYHSMTGRNVNEEDYVLNSREDFDVVRATLARDSPASDVQKAAWFYELIRYSYAAGLTSFGSQPHDMWSNFPLIEQAHRRLAKVVIENKDFEKLIRQYDRPASLFYLDPPYHATEGYYQNIGEDGFTETDHIRLRDALMRIEGKFLLSYNDDEFIRSLYDRPGIYLMETTRINNIKQRYDNGAQFPELIIANYDMHERLRVAPSQMNLFDLTGGDTAWLKS